MELIVDTRAVQKKAGHCMARSSPGRVAAADKMYAIQLPFQLCSNQSMKQGWRGLQGVLSIIVSKSGDEIVCSSNKQTLPLRNVRWDVSCAVIYLIYNVRWLLVSYGYAAPARMRK